MKKIIKERIRSIAVGSLIGFSIGSLIPRCISLYENQQEQIVAIEKQMKENNRIMDSIMSDNNTELSKIATNVINNISSINIDNLSTKQLEVTKEQIIAIYKLYNEECHQHQYQTLYDEQNDNIKWEEAAKKIYENSQKVAKAEETDDKLESFSEEETKTLVERIKTAYEQIKKDFPEYDTRELACKLEYYALLRSGKDNGNIIATTSAEEIVYYPSYNKLVSTAQEDTTYHEGFHLMVNNCIDNRDNDYLSSLMPTFIEENYASLYAKDLTDFYQISYMNYNEALNLLQLSLALTDSYQIDELLADTIYNDPISFLKEFPVYGTDKEKFLLDTLEALRGLNVLVNSEVASTYYYPNSTYTMEILNQIKESTYKQISKIFYNNLIVLNEEHKEMTFEDNITFVKLFMKIQENIPIDVEYVTVDETKGQSEVPLQDKKEDSILTPEQRKPVIKLQKKLASDYFIDYITAKYNKPQEEVESQLFDAKDISEEYEFPEFLDTEKKEFYQYLVENSQSTGFKESRQLVKRK